VAKVCGDKPFEKAGGSLFSGARPKKQGRTHTPVGREVPHLFKNGRTFESTFKTSDTPKRSTAKGQGGFFSVVCCRTRDRFFRKGGAKGNLKKRKNKRKKKIKEKLMKGRN